jgi:hypothetical protein
LQLLESARDRDVRQSQFAAQLALSVFDKERRFQFEQLQFAQELAQQELEAERRITELDPSEFKSVQGGLFNIRTGEFVVPPRPVEPKAPKAPTAAQRLAAGFATRVGSSGKIISELGEQFAGFLAKVPGAPEAFKTEDRKRFEQASRDFINAVLRRESGAAIAPSEFTSAELQYLPQRGDGEAVLAQKAQNRLVQQRALELEAGAAFAELRGALPPPIGTVEFQGQSLPIGSIITNDAGQQARLEADGTVTPL